MTYSLYFTKQALKNLDRINEPFYSAIKIAIHNLTKTPRPQGYKKLKGREALRIRVADYRIIYKVQDNILLVEVITVGHRKDVYS